MVTKEIKVTSQFKAQTIKAIISIILFLLTYIVMLTLAVALTALCVYGGIMLIISFPRFLTIALGIGLASLGVFVLFFLVKFIFKSHKVDRSHLKEINKADEPQLFKLIEEIVTEVGSSFPKRVYLSYDVNAGVFYDSNFWSMLFPVKKNLQIGLGLINTVNISELKSILSHEFGHFSQRTMKVGSYVYNVNQIIFNLLFENDAYDDMIRKWAGISGYFSIFVLIAVKIIEGIKWILNQMYGYVNISYMGLSREMEFHADAIAASVTGYEPLKTALLRLPLAEHSYNSVLSYYENKLSENKKAENIYADHYFVMNFLAKDSEVIISDFLPQVSEVELNKFNKSKLVIKDQWASHPSTVDRIDSLEKTGRKAKVIQKELANTLLSEPVKTHKEITNALFNDLINLEESITVTNSVFKVEYTEEYAQNSFSKLYNGYYDNKNPIFFELEKLEDGPNYLQIEELFSEEKVDLVYTALALESDIETLEQISHKTIKLKTFDYDGEKYKRNESNSLIKKLENEQEAINAKIKLNDIAIFRFFRMVEKEGSKGNSLLKLYNEYFTFDKSFDTKIQLYSKLSDDLQFINLTTPFEQIRENFNDVARTEKGLKKEIQNLLNLDVHQEVITQEIRKSFELYLSDNWIYFGNENYFDDSLKVLFTALNNYAFVLSSLYFLHKKKLLSYQIEILDN